MSASHLTPTLAHLPTNLNELSMTRRLLMIAPQFPPSRAVAAKRPLHFARHLPSFGWEPAVVCLGAEVLREPALEPLIPPVPLYRGYRGGPLARREDAKSAARAQQSVYAAQHAKAQHQSSKKRGLKSALKSFWSRSVGVFDQYTKHLPWTRGPIERFMREQRCELIYATGGPFSALLLATHLSRRAKLPLVLDLRDPWSIEPNYQADRNALGQWLIDRAEAWCFKHASAVILNTASACEAYQHTYAGRVPKERFSFLRNSFDPELYCERPEPPSADAPFQVAYFGHLRPSKNALLFLEAYRAWLDRRQLTPQDSQLLMLGEVSEADRHKMSALKLSEHICSASPVPFTDAPKVLGRVDLLLDLMGPNHHMQIGGKLYDYLACERPILSISPNTELDELFRATGAGERVELNLEAIIGALERAYERKRSGVPFTPNQEALYAMSAKPLTAQLAALLDEAVGS